MKYFLITALLLGMIACGDASTEKQIPEKIQQPEPSTANPPVNTSPNGSNTGLKQGEYLEYYPSGILKIKGFHNQALNRDGLWISYYEEGTKWSESYYLDGKRDGHSITFYPNGQIRYVGEYKKDEKIGTWTFYDEAGNLTHEEKY